MRLFKAVVERDEQLEAGIRRIILETLECGHQFICRPPANQKNAFRRRCAECEKKAGK